MRWETVPLGDVVSPVSSRAGARKLPVYSVTKHSGFVPSTDYFKKQVFSQDLSTYKVVEKGQFAYATIHLDEGSIGVAPEACIISPMYTVFSVDQSRVDAGYLIRLMKSPTAVAQYSRLGRGTAERRKSISLEALGRLGVHLPPLPEQRRIAAILDDADALRSTWGETRESARRAIGSRISALLSKSTDIKPLAQLLAEPMRNGISPSRGGRYEGEVLTLSAITRGAFDLRQRKSDLFAAPHAADKLAIEGLHLICRGNGNAELVGAMVAVTDQLDGVAFPDTMIGFRPSSEINSPTLVAAWRHPTVRDQLRRAARTTNGTYKVNQQSLSSIMVPVPRREDQEQIAALDAERARLDSQLARGLVSLDELFASLQHRAFRGEL